MPFAEPLAGWPAVSSREAGAERVRHPRDSARTATRLTRLPQVDVVKLIRALKRAGFLESEQRGSHLTLKHPTKVTRTTVPIHGGDIHRGLLKQILKQVGLKESEFRELL